MICEVLPNSDNFFFFFNESQMVVSNNVYGFLFYPLCIQSIIGFWNDLWGSSKLWSNFSVSNESQLVVSNNAFWTQFDAGSGLMMWVWSHPINPAVCIRCMDDVVLGLLAKVTGKSSKELRKKLNLMFHLFYHFQKVTSGSVGWFRISSTFFRFYLFPCISPRNRT